MTDAAREPEAPADDDWSPLPPPTLDAERPDSRRREVVLKAPAIAPVAKAATTEPVAIDPAEQERALRELQERLRSSRAPSNPVHAAFAHAARRTAVAPPASVASPRDPRDTSIDGSTDRSRSIEFDDGHDAREDQAWFQQLPEAERDRLREEWRWKREQFRDLPRRKRRDVALAAGQGAVVFLFVAVLTSVASGYDGATGWLVLAGAAAAALARLANGGRFAFALAGALAYAAAMRGALLQSTLLWYVWSASAFGLALLGLDREMRQSGGFLGVLRVTKKPTNPATVQGSQIQTASDASTSSPHDEKNARTPSGATAIGRNAKNSRS